MSSDRVKTQSLTVENGGNGKTFPNSAIFQSFSIGFISKVVLVDSYLCTKF